MTPQSCDQVPYDQAFSLGEIFFSHKLTFGRNSISDFAYEFAFLITNCNRTGSLYDG